MHVRRRKVDIIDTFSFRFPKYPLYIRIGSTMAHKRKNPRSKYCAELSLYRWNVMLLYMERTSWTRKNTREKSELKYMSDCNTILALIVRCLIWEKLSSWDRYAHRGPYCLEIKCLPWSLSSSVFVVLVLVVISTRVTSTSSSSSYYYFTTQSIGIFNHDASFFSIRPVSSACCCVVTSWTFL